MKKFLLFSLLVGSLLALNHSGKLAPQVLGRDYNIYYRIDYSIAAAYEWFWMPDGDYPY